MKSFSHILRVYLLPALLTFSITQCERSPEVETRTKKEIDTNEQTSTKEEPFLLMYDLEHDVFSAVLSSIVDTNSDQFILSIPQDVEFTDLPSQTLNNLHYSIQQYRESKFPDLNEYHSIHSITHLFDKDKFTFSDSEFIAISNNTIFAHLSSPHNHKNLIDFIEKVIFDLNHQNNFSSHTAEFSIIRTLSF